MKMPANPESQNFNSGPFGAVWHPQSEPVHSLDDEK
jgi:hypothetical protein